MYEKSLDGALQTVAFLTGVEESDLTQSVQSRVGIQILVCLIPKSIVLSHIPT